MTPKGIKRRQDETRTWPRMYDGSAKTKNHNAEQRVPLRVKKSEYQYNQQKRVRSIDAVNKKTKHFRHAGAEVSDIMEMDGSLIWLPTLAGGVYTLLPECSRLH